MDKKDMLEHVTKVTCRAYMKRFAAGSSGNANIRVQGQVYIPPGGGCLGDLTAEGMIMLEADGFVPSTGGPDYGDRRPSEETGTYPACYGSRPDTPCLFYLHSPYSIVVVCRGQGDRGPAMGVPAYTPGYTARVGRISVIPYYRPGSKELTEAVFGVMCRRDSLLLASHGMVAVGKSPGAVLTVAEEAEENAHLAMLLEGQGIPPGGE